MTRHICTRCGHEQSMPVKFGGRYVCAHHLRIDHDAPYEVLTKDEANKDRRAA